MSTEAHQLDQLRNPSQEDQFVLNYKSNQRENMKETMFFLKFEKIKVVTSPIFMLNFLKFMQIPVSQQKINVNRTVNLQSKDILIGLPFNNALDCFAIKSDITYLKDTLVTINNYKEDVSIKENIVC